MKKTLLRCALFLCAALLCSFPVSASSGLLDDLKESAGVDRLAELLPPELEAWADADETTFANADLGGTVFRRLISSVGEALRAQGKLFALILALLAISAFAGAMRHAAIFDTVGDALEYLGVLTLAGLCFASLQSAFGALYEALRAMATFIGGMLPITGAIYTLSGAATTAAAQSASFLGALAVLDAIVTSYLFPLMSVSFALAAANAVSGLKLQALERFFRRTVSVLLGAVFTVLLFLLSIQTLLCASGDTLLLRSTRYAAANFVPAVGGLFGEAAKTVFSAMGVLRSTVGTIGIFVVGWLALSPLAGLLVRRALFCLCAALSDALGLERQAQFLSSCGETLGLGAAIGLSCGVFFILAFAVFVRVPVGG